MDYEKLFDKLGIQHSTDDYRRQQWNRFKKNEKAKYMVFKPGICQADLQFYGKEESSNKSKRDHNNVILLVVVDTMTKAVDFEPVLTKQSSSIRQGFTKILRREHIGKHGIQHLYSDSGTEFKNVGMKKFCASRNIIQHFTLPARKQQNAIVEAFNSVLRKILTLKQNQNIKEGIKDHKGDTPHIFTPLPILRTAMNDKRTRWPLIRDFILPIKQEKINQKDAEDVKNGGVVPIGTLVYIKNEKPQDVNGRFTNRFKFRMGDFFFSKKVHVVEQVLAYPNGNSIRYKVSGIHNATYTKSELLPVQEKQILEKEKALNNKKEQQATLNTLQKEIKVKINELKEENLSSEKKEKLTKEIKSLSVAIQEALKKLYTTNLEVLEKKIQEKIVLIQNVDLSKEKRKELKEEIEKLGVEVNRVLEQKKTHEKKVEKGKTELQTKYAR